MFQKKVDPKELRRTKPTLRILVCGDRNWTDFDLIEKVLREYEPSTIIHGAARGADSIAGEVGRKLGCHVVEYPANWLAFGKAAGPIRNKEMLEKGTPDLVLAFHSDIGQSKGTLHMVNIAAAARVPTRVVKGRDE